MVLAAGKRVGPYRITAQIGVGGMGEVYRAWDAKLRRDVAIKVLPAPIARDRDYLARFEREALAVAALSHPNILSIFDFGTEGGISYAVTELLEGETLRAKAQLRRRFLMVRPSVMRCRLPGESPRRTRRASSIGI